MLWLIFAILYDSILSYWHVVVLAAFLSQLRIWIGGYWVFVAFAIMVLFFAYSEVNAPAIDKDAIFIIGSALRFFCVCAFVGLAAAVGAALRTRMNLDAIKGDGAAEASDSEES